MATYYEQLNVAPTAASSEIEATCDRLYDQWRRLVTHQDRNLAGQADRALAHLETIRFTLLDDSRRSVYDAAIGVSGTMGGLADLSLAEAFLAPAAQVAAPAPQLPRAKVPQSPWACPSLECQAENPTNTQYCLSCGTQVVRTCPECGATTSMVRTGFCGKCGFKYDAALERRRVALEVDSLQRQVVEQDRHAAEMDGRGRRVEALSIAETRDALKREIAELRLRYMQLDHRLTAEDREQAQGDAERLAMQAPARTAQRTRSGRVSCPRCGYENIQQRLTCKGCRWELKKPYSV
jgi:curved DNA-binding protein CbpA